MNHEQEVHQGGNSAQEVHRRKNQFCRDFIGALYRRIRLLHSRDLPFVAKPIRRLNPNYVVDLANYHVEIDRLVTEFLSEYVRLNVHESTVSSLYMNIWLIITCYCLGESAKSGSDG